MNRRFVKLNYFSLQKELIVKRKHLLAILCATLFVFIFTTLSAFAQTTKPRPKAKIRGDRYSYKIYDEDFVNTPKWNLDEGEPPVSISRAIQIAKVNLSRFVEASDKFRVRSIQLREFSNSGKWYYSIRFFCRGRVCRNLDIRSFQILVKMNESVIEPKILPPDF